MKHVESFFQKLWHDERGQATDIPGIPQTPQRRAGSACWAHRVTSASERERRNY